MKFTSIVAVSLLASPLLALPVGNTNQDHAKRADLYLPISTFWVKDAGTAIDFTASNGKRADLYPPTSPSNIKDSTYDRRAKVKRAQLYDPVGFFLSKAEGDEPGDGEKKAKRSQLYDPVGFFLSKAKGGEGEH